MATASLSTVEDGARRPPTAPCPTTPATAYGARPKANLGARAATHNRVRTDRVDQAGSLSLRVRGRLHHLGVGRT